jgi:hypothetical protein
LTNGTSLGIAEAEGVSIQLGSGHPTDIFVHMLVEYDGPHDDLKNHLVIA